MAESEREPLAGRVPENRLAAAIERVRTDQANRDDVVVEMKQAARARLEILAQELRPLFNDIPPDHDCFQFGLTNGETPRLWIDLTTHVRMGREPRTYEFVKDTRNGRILLGDSTDSETIARQVADYVAERILARERAVEGEWQDMRTVAQEEERKSESGETGRARGGSVLAFLIGLLVGAAAMVAWAWFLVPPDL